MNPNCFCKTKHVSLVLIFSLFAAFVLLPELATGGHASSMGDDWDEVFDTARAVLASLDVGRIERIKDGELRDAAMRAYRALKSCAKVNKSQSSSIKRAAVADFERAYKDVEKEAERGEYRDCAAKCKGDGAPCEKDCASAGKKICGCKMTQFGCFATKCLSN